MTQAYTQRMIRIHTPLSYRTFVPPTTGVVRTVYASSVTVTNRNLTFHVANQTKIKVRQSISSVRCSRLPYTQHPTTLLIHSGSCMRGLVLQLLLQPPSNALMQASDISIMFSQRSPDLQNFHSLSVYNIIRPSVFLVQAASIYSDGVRLCRCLV